MLEVDEEPVEAGAGDHLDAVVGGEDRRRALEEIEVAALVRLLDVAREECAVAARELRRGRAPGALAAGELGGLHLQVELALLDVELDQITAPHERERAAD